MQILIECVGSAGDVHPFIGIGHVLAARGHDVTLFANEVFRAPVESAGIGFAPSGPAAWFERSTNDPDLWHPLRGPRVVIGGVMEHIFEPTVGLLRRRVAGREGATVLVGSTLAFAAHCVAEHARVPYVSAHLAPSIFRSEHRAPRLPGPPVPHWAPRWWRRLNYRLADAVVDRLVCPRLNAVRARLELAPVRRVFDRWIHQGDATLGLFPDWFAVPQPDWPCVHMTGFPLFDEDAQRPVDPDLDAWIDDGPPPLVFTHGSANIRARRFFEVAAAAGRQLGRRALLVTTQPADVAGLTDDSIRYQRYVPFSRVVPRAAVFVGHGGIGTTAQGLAAGVPQLVVAMGFDQLDNGARVAELGCGAMTTLARFTVPRAVRLLDRLLTDGGIRDAARATGARARDVGGAERAADVIVAAAR